MIVSKRGDWYAANVGEELVMMSVKEGRYVGLSEVGARIWAMLDAPRSVADICATLLREFDVAPDVCRAEVDVFLADLAKEGAVTLDQPA